MVSKQSRKTATATGRNGVQGFWIKKLASLHERTGFQLNKILNGKEQLPECLTYVQPAFGQKGQTKGNTQDNYRPISCLLLMWRLLTGIISKYLYSFLEEENTLPEEQKGCRRNSRGTKDQVLLDEAMLREYKRRSTNFAIAWIGYRKTYAMIPHCWISGCLELFGVAKNTKKFLVNSTQQWKLESMSNRVSLGNVEIRRGICQGDNLYPPTFCAMCGSIIIDVKKSEILLRT